MNAVSGSILSFTTLSSVPRGQTIAESIYLTCDDGVSACPGQVTEQYGYSNLRAPILERQFA